MAKAQDNIEAKAPLAAAPEPEGKRLVTILYSERRDLYRIPAMDKPLWLSVATFPISEMLSTSENLAGILGAQRSADGKLWRKSYSTGWAAIKPGAIVPMPADDPMVLDYAALK